MILFALVEFFLSDLTVPRGKDVPFHVACSRRKFMLAITINNLLKAG